MSFSLLKSTLLGKFYGIWFESLSCRVRKLLLLACLLMCIAVPTVATMTLLNLLLTIPRTTEYAVCVVPCAATVLFLTMSLSLEVVAVILHLTIGVNVSDNYGWRTPNRYTSRIASLLSFACTFSIRSHRPITPMNWSTLERRRVS